MAWYLVDGLPLWIITAAMARYPQALPNLLRLQDKQRISGLHPVQPNCQTPPSLASLFAGVTTRQTALIGFDIPTFDPRNVLTSRAAFESLPSGLSLIWTRAAACGEVVRLSHIPYVDMDIMSHAIRSYSYGFNPAHISPAVFFPLQAEAVLGSSVRAIPTVGWTPVTLTGGFLGLAARRQIAGHERILYTGTWPVDIVGDDPIPAEIQSHAFMATGLQKHYRAGALGQTLMQGGEGSAEALFIETLRVMSHRYAAEWLHHLKVAESGLIVAYQPIIDLALHELVGFVAPECRHWSAERERIIWPLLLSLLTDLDRVIGQSYKFLRHGDRMIVTSDHGMSPVDTTVRPNVLLAQRGWLQEDSDGGIEPTESYAFYHPAENGLLCLNTKALANAGLPPELLMQVLVADMDELTGRHAAVEVWRDTESALAPPAWLTARHFLGGGRFVQLLPDLQGPGCELSTKTGEHMLATGLPELSGVVLDLSPEMLGFPRAGVPTHHVARYLERDRSRAVCID